MPGMVAFKRRWSVGSDDLIVPGVIFSTLHAICLIAVVTVLGLDAIQYQQQYDNNNNINSHSGSAAVIINNEFVVNQDQHHEFISSIADDSTSNSSSTAFNVYTVTTNGSQSPAALDFDLQVNATNTSTSTGQQQQNVAECSCPIVTEVILLIIQTVNLVVSILLEWAMILLALRGTILNDKPRRLMPTVVYSRFALFICQCFWSFFLLGWLYIYTSSAGKRVLICSAVFELCVAIAFAFTVWCTYDRVGRLKVKMSRVTHRSQQRKVAPNKYAESSRPHWRQRKISRTVQQRWSERFKILFCCMGRSDQYQDSFSDIAWLMADFFNDLDLVPTDIVTGLILLRKQQKKMQQLTTATPPPSQSTTDTEQHSESAGRHVYEFLSGVPVTASTQFLSATTAAAADKPEEYHQHQLLKHAAHYMKYALAAYGWKMNLLMPGQANKMVAMCKTFKNCCCAWGCCCQGDESIVIDGANRLLGFNIATLKQMIGGGGGNPASDYDITFVSFHADVAKTPFFIAIDYRHQSVILSIRGTISMKDIITDLQAEAEPIQLLTTTTTNSSSRSNSNHQGWFGHKGMVQAAKYIHSRLENENLLGQAFSHSPQRGTQHFQLVIVGHSLGAGTAAILALLLRQQYPAENMHCYAYSPPGGLLSWQAAEYSRSFITSIVVGKDVVPRIGLVQLADLRTSLVSAIKKNPHSKWRILGSSIACCNNPRSQMDCSSSTATAKRLFIHPALNQVTTHLSGTVVNLNKGHPRKRQIVEHRISFSAHQPLFPPGRIIHLVRQHHSPTAAGERTADPDSQLDKECITYHAILADTFDFGEVLISPAMFRDHMPATVLFALEQVIKQSSNSQTISNDGNQIESSNHQHEITIDVMTIDQQSSESESESSSNSEVHNMTQL